MRCLNRADRSRMEPALGLSKKAPVQSWRGLDPKASVSKVNFAARYTAPPRPFLSGNLKKQANRSLLLRLVAQVEQQTPFCGFSTSWAIGPCGAKAPLEAPAHCKRSTGSACKSALIFTLACCANARGHLEATNSLSSSPHECGTSANPAGCGRSCSSS